MNMLFANEYLSRGGFDKAYKDLIRNIFVAGNIEHPRLMKTREILGQSLVIPDASECLLISPVRSMNYRFAIAEALWIIAGQNDLATIAAVNKQYAKFSDDGVTMAGAYGPRLEKQCDYIKKILRNDPSSRQAVSTIWSPCPQPSKDIPCTISVQFLIRDRHLCSIWNMRSSDAWLGLPYDVFSFGLYTNWLAYNLELPTGPMQLNLGSSHLYEEHWEVAETLPTSYTGILKIPPFNEALSHLMKAYHKQNSADCLSYLREIWGLRVTSK